MTLSAWRPLKDAPRDKAIIIRDGHRRLLAGALPDAPHEGAEFAPIADTYELDRAVQGEIARAFGELLGGLKVASRHEYLARRAHPWSRSARERSATDHRRNAVSNFRRILHTAMGGRIPDEVP